MHPADLDGALQPTKVLASGDGGSDQTRLPFSIDTALMRGKASGSRVRIGLGLTSTLTLTLILTLTLTLTLILIAIPH